MATIDLGKIKIVWKGTYAGGTSYVVDEAVVHNGTSYICVANTTGNAPPNATYWNVMAQAGTNGTNGTDVGTVLTTQGDILYRDGSGLQRLAKGTAGQVLKMNAAANAPEYGTVASDFVKITSGTLSNQGDVIINNLDFTTYKHFRIYLTNINTQNNASYVAARLQYDNSGSPATDAGNEYSYAMRGYRVYGQAGEIGEDSGTSLQDRIRTNWQVTQTSNGANWKQEITFEFSAWNNTDSSKHMKIFGLGVYDNGTEYHHYNYGMASSRNTSRAYNGIRFFLDNSNNFNCSYAVYGIK